MARLPPPMTMITSSIPDSIASSTPYWMVDWSTRGSISLGCALVTGRNRVPSPAAVMIALRTGVRLIRHNVRRGRIRAPDDRHRGAPRASRGRVPGDATRGREGRVCDAFDDHAHGAGRPPVRGGPPARGPDDRRLRGLRPAPGVGRARRDHHGHEPAEGGPGQPPAVRGDL